jgi:hypothetical protein
MVGAGIKGLVFFAAAVFLMVYPIENASVFRAQTPVEPVVYDEAAEDLPESELAENITEERSGFGLTEEQASVFGRYRVITGIGLAQDDLLRGHARPHRVEQRDSRQEG